MSTNLPAIPEPKRADPKPAILEELAGRWSPYRFDQRSVDPGLIQQCLTAASWAASSFNEQPWFFLIAFREAESEFGRILRCLTDTNQVWAKYASVLMLTASKETFTRNGKPNRVHQHDLGQAAANFCTQATALGLCVHQMAGIHIDAIRKEFAIPEGYAPQTAIAVGYPALVNLPGQEELESRDHAARTRKPLNEFVYSGQWGNPYSW